MGVTTSDASAAPAATDTSMAWALGFFRALRRDAWVYGAVAACLAGTVALEACYGQDPLRDLGGLALHHGLGWLGLSVQLVMLLVAVKVGCVLVRDRPRQPLQPACQAAAEVLTPDTMAGVVLFGSLAMFMAAFTTVKILLPLINPFWCDPALARIDRALHGGHDPWTLLRPVLDGPAVLRAVEFCYSPLWMASVAVWTLFFCARCPDGPLRRRFLLCFLLAWVLCGTVASGAFMSGGPAFYDLLVGGAPRFAALRAGLAFDAGPFSAASEQAMLWHFRQLGQAGVGAGISAFPSLHVTMAVLCALGAWGVHRAAGLIWSGFALIIMAGSVRLGWHYAVDGYAAAAGMAVLWWAVGRMVGAERRR